MNENELDFRIRILLAKARNLYYYTSLITSPRIQLMHPVRGFRKNCVDLLRIIPEGNMKYEFTRTWLLEVIRSISPKITSEECKPWIINILGGKLKVINNE